MLANEGCTVEGGVDLLADTEVQSDLRALARTIAEKEIAPRAREWDEQGRYPSEAVDAFREAGLFGITIGEEYGGAGLGDVEAAIVLEEIARADVSSAIVLQLTYNTGARAVEHLGSDALKQRWLPRAAAGEVQFCIGVTEAEAGSAVPEMRASLTPTDGGYRLNAYKNFVTAGHAGHACLVWTRFPGGQGARGIGSVLVDLTAEGVSVAGIHEQMGIRSMTEAEVAFDDVFVSEDDVVAHGDPDTTDAFRGMLTHLNHERCGNAAMCIGAAQGALEHAVRYADQRILGGKPLRELQGIQWKLADMSLELDAARLLLYRAVALTPAGGTPPALETAMAKAKANQVAKLVCDEAIQILGGYGYSREYPVERAYRDIRGLCIGAGTIEVMRNYIGGRISTGRIPAGPAWRDATH